MKDIPAFTTENGVVSLVLRELPYSKRAYVSVISANDMKAMTEDVIGFCKALDAQELYGYADLFAGGYPLAETVFLMEGTKQAVQTAQLQAVQEENLLRFCELYNSKMKHLKTACYMTAEEALRLVREKKAYFVQENGHTIGFGVLEENKIRSLASTAPGAGEKVIYALGSLIPGDKIFLEAAQSNEKAMRLYERLGFVCVKTLDRWYKIF